MKWYQWAAIGLAGVCALGLAVIFFTPLLDRFNVDVFPEED